MTTFGGLPLLHCCWWRQEPARAENNYPDRAIRLLRRDGRVAGRSFHQPKAAAAGGHLYVSDHGADAVIHVDPRAMAGSFYYQLNSVECRLAGVCHPVMVPAGYPNWNP